jgi:hypothetical protein
MSRIYLAAVLLGAFGGGLAGAHEAWRHGMSAELSGSSAAGPARTLLVRADGSVCAPRFSAAGSTLVCR